VANGGGRTSDRSGIFEWLSDGSVLRVPVDAIAGAVATAEITVEIEALVRCVVTLNDSVENERALAAGERASIVLTVTQESVDVVNNVGSWLDESWVGHERGLYEVDRGHLDDAQEVGTWCGAAVLLRASHLFDVGLFEESFFLYYEDTDLAVRGRGRGWRFVVEPTSVVRHIHSASTVESSLATCSSPLLTRVRRSLKWSSVGRGQIRRRLFVDCVRMLPRCNYCRHRFQ
jgi:hypothetical protein